MRTIRENGNHVRPLRPADEIANAIEQRIGTLEFANRLRSGVNNHRVERFDLCGTKRLRSKVFYLHVTTAHVIKFWKPFLHLVSHFRVLPPRDTAIRAAHRAALNRAVGINQLRRNQSHSAARWPAHAKSRHVTGVLTEVINRFVGRKLLNLYRLTSFNRLQRFACNTVPAQRPRRTHDRDRVLPILVLKLPLVPACGIQPRIKIFSAKNTIERDAAWMRAPRFIRDHELLRAVGVFEFDLANRAQRPKRTRELRETISPLDVIHAVA